MGAMPDIGERKIAFSRGVVLSAQAPPLLIGNVGVSAFPVFVTVAGRRATDWATDFDQLGVV